MPSGCSTPELMELPVVICPAYRGLLERNKTALVTSFRNWLVRMGPFAHVMGAGTCGYGGGGAPRPPPLRHAAPQLAGEDGAIRPRDGGRDLRVWRERHAPSPPVTKRASTLPSTAQTQGHRKSVPALRGTR